MWINANALKDISPPIHAENFFSLPSIPITYKTIRNSSKTKNGVHPSFLPIACHIQSKRPFYNAIKTIGMNETDSNLP